MISPGMTFEQMANDPDEGRLLGALWSDPDEETGWLAYAGFLESVGEPRGDFLRLERLLSGKVGRVELTPACQARYRELLELLTPFGLWLVLIRRVDRLLNCGQASALPLRVRFQCQARK